MNQTPIKKRSEQQNPFSIAELDANWQELRDRLDYNRDGYNSISELGALVELLIERLSRPTLLINGRPFTLIKHPDNNDPANKYVLELNDFIANGIGWDSTKVWILAQLTANDGSAETDWRVMSANNI